jgi:hypothetical protein
MSRPPTPARRDQRPVEANALGYWAELPIRHVCVLLEQPGVREDADLISWLRAARSSYDAGDYSEALQVLKWSLQRMPSIEPYLFHYVAVCEQVMAVPITPAERQYEEKRARSRALPRWCRWMTGSEERQVRCKYCGRYTPYIDPNTPTFGFRTAANGCSACGRMYPMPSWMWDSPEGRIYSYTRVSFNDEAFYQEFERDYRPLPRCGGDERRERREAELKEVAKDAAAAGIDFADVQRIGDKYSSLLDNMGQDLVRLGKIKPEVYDQHTGMYFPRLFMASDHTYADPELEAFAPHVRPIVEITEAMAIYSTQVCQAIAEAATYEEITQNPTLALPADGSVPIPEDWTVTVATTRGEYVVSPGAALYLKKNKLSVGSYRGVSAR